ncbi:hypothetical protein L596_014027 [Steinernema carpocapsae]|uniref:RNA helicase n=1 Tax=Steinernema carpocapsae TaxID=34508 RepID=A0A4U5NBG8_STECR|nr:hypothetical protein L596_014027 [Steinernema carpocapsae]
MGKRSKTKVTFAEPESQEQPQEAVEEAFEAAFSDFELDERLLKAIGELGWQRPTQVQESMIPMALEGKNILARARTGSGKTAAFLLPTLQKVIQLSSNTSEKGPFAIFVTPTKELTTQVFAQLKALVAFFLASRESRRHGRSHADRPSGHDRFHPNRLLQAADSHKNLLTNVRHVVLDEADLLFSLGYEEEMKNIKNRLPSRYQTILTSATLSEDMTDLKKIFCVGPVVSLKLKEGQLPGSDQLAQYHIYCNDDDQRFAILVSMIKLKLLVGKTIIFVKDVERCYQLSLFLQAFKIGTCILNAELPANCRCRIVHEFNEGRYNFVIASDMGDMGDEEEDAEGEPKPKKSKKKKVAMDKEAGVSRGIDFHHVSNVVNFDFPTSLEAYIHRVGRTARGWNKGTALSFAAPDERELLDEVSEEINSQMGCKVIMPYEVRMADLDAFFLRTREVIGQITRVAIREARLAEIRAEALRSNRLRAYFAANPREKAALENDKRTHRLRTADSVAGVSEYMVPVTLRGIDYSQDTTKRSKAEIRKLRKQRKKKQTQKRPNAKNSKDPLKTFDF